MIKYYDEHPESREKVSERMLKHFEEHPETREKIGEAMSKFLEEHPEAQVKMSKYRWKNPEAPKKQSDAMIKHYEEHPEALEQKREQLENLNREKRKEIRDIHKFLTDIRNGMPSKDLTINLGITRHTLNKRINELLGHLGIKNYRSAKKYLRNLPKDDFDYILRLIRI